MTRTAIAVPLLAALLFGATFAYADHNRYDNRSYDSYYYGNTYGGYDNYGYQNDYRRKPTCSISTYRTSGANPYDGRVTLTWWSSNATHAYVTGLGTVATAGTQTVYDSSYSSYTLTVSGPGGSTTCSASSPFYDAGSRHYNHYRDYGYVSNPAFNYSLYSYPYTSGTIYPTNYVTLSQVPYTGFDFGLFGNSLYWIMMVLLAAAGAYLIVYSHSGTMPRAFAQEVAMAARNQIRLVKTIVR